MAQARLRWAGAEREVLADSGLAYTHVRLVGHGAPARIPKQSRVDLAPAANLAYRAACFEPAARSGHTPLDLVHATLHTSTTWDATGSVVLGVDAVARACVDWSREMGPSVVAWNDWHLPLRRAMWLWSITWCAKWRVASRAASAATVAGEDWSTDLSEPALVAPMRGRVDHDLSAPTVERMLDEMAALGQTLPTTALQDAVIIGPSP